MRKFSYVLSGLVLAGAFSLPMFAQSLNITYYTIAANDPDANNLAGGVYDNEVQSALGPNGLPVLNISLFGCTSDCYTQVGAPGFPNGTNSNTPNVNVMSDGEITYWDPTDNPYVTETGTAIVNLPFDVSSNFFPPNGTGGCDGPSPCDGYQAAVLSGNLIVPADTSESISFNIGSDDMSFAYLGGQVVCDDGGVHPSSSTICTTDTITTGATAESIPLEVFFVDINQSQAGLIFGINTSGITTTPSGVPEPNTLLMLGTGLLGLAGTAKRKFFS